MTCNEGNFGSRCKHCYLQRQMRVYCGLMFRHRMQRRRSFGQNRITSQRTTQLAVQENEISNDRSTEDQAILRTKTK